MYCHKTKCFKHYNTRNVTTLNQTLMVIDVFQRHIVTAHVTHCVRRYYAEIIPDEFHSMSFIHMCTI
jgi:hypothetical protein